jgi:hypothetical protein
MTAQNEEKMREAFEKWAKYPRGKTYPARELEIWQAATEAEKFAWGDLNNKLCARNEELHIELAAAESGLNVGLESGSIQREEIGMSDFWFDAKSVWRGIRAMKRESKKAKWTIAWLPRRCWLHAWTPMWHDGKGPYVSCGIWVIAIYRGF